MFSDQFPHLDPNHQDHHAVQYVVTVFFAPDHYDAVQFVGSAIYQHECSVYIAVSAELQCLYIIVMLSSLSVAPLGDHNVYISIQNYVIIRNQYIEC